MDAVTWALMTAGKTYRYLVHLAVCMALVCLYFLPSLLANWSAPVALQWIMIRGLLFGFINFHLFYALVFVILPLHAAKAHGKAVAGVVLTILFFCLLKYGVGLLYPEQVLRRAIPLVGFSPPYTPFFTYLRYTLQTGIAVTLAAYAYRIFLNWRYSDQESRVMEKAVMETSRQYERMVFSSQLLLRHLRALEGVLDVETERDKTGVPGILALSELLRYMLYDRSVQAGKTTLAKELHYYRIYLDLHNRLFPQQPVQLHIEGASTGLSVEPLLLQTATEKLLQQQANPAPLSLWLYIHNDSLELSIHPKKAPSKLLSRIRNFRALRGFKTRLYVENI